MIKSKLIAKLSNTMTHLPEKKVADAVNHILQTIEDALSQGKRIEIRGFGSFSLHYRPARRAHNPKTGEQVTTDAKYTPHFKPGKELRERVNASRKNVPLQDDD